MRSCTFRLALVGLLGAMPTLGGSACRSTDPGTTNLAFDPDVDRAKVDADVVRAMATGDSLSVIVLGQSQLLERIGGLERFEQSHDGVPRQAIRAEVVTRLRTLADAQQQAIIATIGSATRVRRLWIYNAVAGTMSPAQIAALSQLSSVAFIFPNFDERVVFPGGQGRVSVVIPGTPQSTFDPRRSAAAWNLRWLGVDRVWSELGELGSGAVIASIDDGVNYVHADLKSHVWTNSPETPNNGRDDDANGYADDVYGYDFDLMTPEVRSTSTQAQHGTWTSGLMVADGTSGILSGVAPRSHLMVLRAAGHVAIAEAVQYAVAMGADVVNMSFTYRGEGSRRALWRMICDHAVAAGVLMAGGAGNFQMTDAVPIRSPRRRTCRASSWLAAWTRRLRSGHSAARARLNGRA